MFDVSEGELRWQVRVFSYCMHDDTIDNVINR